jgi:hypothetical protein
MSFFKHEKLLAVTVSLSVSILILCGNTPVSPDRVERGNLEISAQVISQALEKVKKTAQTSFDSLIVEVSAADFKTMHHALKVVNSRPVMTDTIANIPAGEQRSVKIWTVDKSGFEIHQDTATMRTIQIKSNETTQVSAYLIPTVGSIYLQIGDVPDTVDSVVAVFTESGTSVSWSSRVKRSTKVFLSLDNIPNNTKGTVGVFGIGPAGDTLYRAVTELTFDITRVGIVNLAFQSFPGSVALNLTIIQPSITLISGKMGQVETDTIEMGGVLITEIMYASNDSEYIELYNTNPTAVVFDTLILDIDGSSKNIINVSFAPNGYYTIGRRALPWVQSSISPVSFLDLTSSGNWVTVRSKDKTMLDRVAFTGVSNTLEWPNVTGKRSITLDTSAYSVTKNNFGRNWISATTLIPSSTSQYGSPGY